MTAMNADLWIKAIGGAVALCGGGFGVFTYFRNSRTKAAEFLLDLHKAFFVDATYQGMKSLLDCEGAAEEARLEARYAVIWRWESEMSEKLFVYGTLHPDRAPDEIAHVVRRFKTLGSGTIRARIHRFHDYPAIKIDQKNGSRVTGEVFQLPSALALKELDEYEEYYPSALDKSLFQRKQVKVRLEDGTSADCWVYEYNGSLPEPARRPSARAAKQKSGLGGLVPVTA